MNSYSLAADSRRWWWLPATAGALGTLAITAVLVVPATSSVAPVDLPATGGSVTGSGTLVERPCYLARPGWNTSRGWEHPVCTTLLRGQDGGLVRYHARPAPDTLP